MSSVSRGALREGGPGTTANAKPALSGNTLFRTVRRALWERARRSTLFAESIVPHDVHRYDRKTWVIKETGFGFRIWCSLDDRAISRPILLDDYELPETRFIARTVRPGDVVVDAGANIGYHTLHLASLVGSSGRVVAFEPLPYLADALDASVAENEFETRVHLHRTALDEAEGHLTLRHAPRTANFGGAHFASTAAAAVPEGHADLSVATARLDDVLRGEPCRFVKLDVEGAEPRVVRGAPLLIRTSRPTILCELHNHQLRLVSECSATEFLAQMSGYGYACLRLERDGTTGRRIDRYDDEAPANVVFVHLATSPEAP